MLIHVFNQGTLIQSPITCASSSGEKSFFPESAKKNKINNTSRLDGLCEP